MWLVASSVFAALGGFAEKSATRFGWTAVCLGVVTAAVAVWFALSCLFGGPSAYQVATAARTANLEASTAIAIANAEALDLAKRRADDAETAAGEARSVGATKAALARLSRKRVREALAPTAGTVCFPDNVLELMKRK